MNIFGSFLPLACLCAIIGYSCAASKRHMSIDKQIMDAAPKASMFDVFHVMPGGDVNVMTELDILLTLDQFERLRGKSKTEGGEGNTRKKRKADKDIALLWDDCLVFYEVDITFTDEDLETIKLAIAEWQKYTCLTFRESTTATSRLQFKNGGGCYSQLGKQEKPQPLVLAPNCRTKGIIIHEIGHAIGWYHEHMRPDRDSYISVNFNAIPVRYHVNFEKYTSNTIETHGIEYDYTSLMHYGDDVLPGSIIALDPTYQDKMGQREGLTFKDIKLANVMYDCPSNMGCVLKTCEFGGFQLYKAFKGVGRCECWCDSGDITDPLVLCSELEQEPPRPSIRPTETPVVDLCYDVRDDCPEMKEQGHCMSKLSLMMDICKESCGFCSPDSGVAPPEPPCMDHDKGCPIMEAAGLCTTLEPVMKKQCPASCGLCPSPPDPCEIQKDVMAMFDIPNGGYRFSTGVLHTVILFFISITLSLQ